MVLKSEVGIREQWRLKQGASLKFGHAVGFRPTNGAISWNVTFEKFMFRPFAENLLSVHSKTTDNSHTHTHQASFQCLQIKIIFLH